MEKPKGHGDFASVIRNTWTTRELLDLTEALGELERHPGFIALTEILTRRAERLVDRLVVDPPGDVRATDQVIGMIGGVRQATRVLESIRYEATEARERATQAAAEADAEGALT